MLIKELLITYYQGVLSPELGSPRPPDRATPRVVTKSATLHERGSYLDTEITNRGNIESAS